MMFNNTNVNAEREQIISSAKLNGTYLKAPNGEDTRLTPEQWVTVRTLSFREWFGDWERNPMSSSKVIDPNGEPLVVYHGSRNGGAFTVFNNQPFFSDDYQTADMFHSEADYNLYINGKYIRAIGDIDASDFCFGLVAQDYTPDEIAQWSDYAVNDAYDKAELIEVVRRLSHWQIPIDQIERVRIEKTPPVHEVYINMRNPKIVDYNGRIWGKENTIPEREQLEDIHDGLIVRNIVEGGYTGELRNGQDPKPSNDYIPRTSFQVKSATQNHGTFLASDPDIRYRAAYHGSPHDFERFDHAFMGTGEGAQAFGWGTYVTEVNGIAKSYATHLTPRAILYDGESLADVLDNEYYFDDAWRVWKKDILSATDTDELKKKINGVYIDGRIAGPRSKRRKELERQKRELLGDIDNGRITIKSSPRNLYTVEIPDNIGDNYLEWNGRADRIIDKVGISEDEYATVDMATGGDVYRYLANKLGSDKAASEFLASRGFAGIEYPAQHTIGGRADRAKNYVIFNEQNVQITDHIQFRFVRAKDAANSELMPATNTEEKMAMVNQLSESLNLQVQVLEDLSCVNRSLIPGDRISPELKGWHNASDGSISIILSTHYDAADIQRTILHEGIAHKGLDELLGRDKANQLYERIYDSLPVLEREELRNRFSYKAEAGAEYVALLAEGGLQPTVMNRVLSAIREFFRQVLHVPLKITDNDILVMLRSSRVALQANKNRSIHPETQSVSSCSAIVSINPDEIIGRIKQLHEESKIFPELPIVHKDSPSNLQLKR